MSLGAKNPPTTTHVYGALAFRNGLAETCLNGSISVLSCSKTIEIPILEEDSYEKNVVMYVVIGEPRHIAGKWSNQGLKPVLEKFKHFGAKRTKLQKVIRYITTTTTITTFSNLTQLTPMLLKPVGPKSIGKSGAK